jgi:competence protein ComEA
MKLMSSLLLLPSLLIVNTSHADPQPTPASIQIHKKINLNTATAEELTHAVKGIGHKRALAIVQYRQHHGPYKTITDLAAVRGIGLRFIQSHRSELDATFVC